MNIFNQDFSNNILYNFLKLFSNIENNYYIINTNCYKKYVFNDYQYINNFINSIKPYYKKHNLFYIQRVLNYNNLMTIIRHICKFKNIPYRNIIKYDKSKYEIIYYIKII